MSRDHDNKFETRVFASPTVSFEKPDREGQNLRISGKYDPIRALDRGAITIDKGTTDPCSNHFMEGFNDVGHQNSDVPITADDVVR